MKKITLAALSFAAILFASCGGQTTTDANETDSLAADSTKVFAQANIEAGIKANLDSLAAEFSKKNVLSLMVNIKNDKISLTEEEAKVQPDYLLDPAVADNAVTYSQKYRAIIMLSTDKAVAGLYGMDEAGYDAAISKLAADLGDPIVKEALESNESLLDMSEEFYEKEETAGRINFFWETACAGMVEQIYIMCQNTEKFLPAFDDEAAANITFRIALIQDALNRLSEYAPELEDLCQAIKPLEVLNATTIDELKSQLASAKAEIETSRAALLK